jgi:PPM family protein phosphatase
VRELPEEGVILLAVADGVGSHVCDWFASETTCQVVCASFAQAMGQRVADRLRFGVQKAHDRVRGETGGCAGAQSTIVAVAWDAVANLIHYASVGDSRLYKHTPLGLVQLTVDDAASVLATVGGETVLSAGMPVFIRGLTKAVGQREVLGVNVLSAEFEEGESLVLATDGMHGYGLFSRDLEAALAKTDLEAALPDLVRRHSAANNDDATIVILRRADVSEGARGLYADALERGADYRDQGLFGHLMAAHLKGELERSAAAGDGEKMRLCFGYAEKFNLLPGRARLIELLSLMIKGGAADRELVQRVRRAIQTSNA